MAKRESRENRRKREREELDSVTLLTPAMAERIKESAFEFVGQMPVLESAVGALVLGQMFGWKVLRIIHEPKTYAKYQRLLGVKFSEVCPERGPLWEHSTGLQWADKLDDFWKVVRGEVKITGRQDAVGVDAPLFEGVA